MVINHMYVGAVCFPVRKIGETDCNACVAILHTPNNWAGMGGYLRTEYSASRCGSVMPFCTGHLHFVECGLNSLSCTCARDKKKQPWAILVKCKRSRLCSTFVVFRNMLSMIARRKVLLEQQAVPGRCLAGPQQVSAICLVGE